MDERDARIRELEEALEAQTRRDAERVARQRKVDERRLRQLRDSITYRVGDEVVRAARSPRRLARLPLVLARLYRRRHLLAETAGVDPSALPSPRRDVTAAAVLGDVTARCLAPELHLVPLTRARWQHEMEARPDLLLVEPASDGNGREWREAIAAWNAGEPNVLADVLAWCNAHDVPTVFWCTEDPANAGADLEAARQFDHVFTTDADRVELYRDALGHDRVGALPFAAQPTIHNPIGNRRDVVPRVCFAGHWPVEQHEAEQLLAPTRELGVLDVVDPHDYDEILAAYRRYAAFLAVAPAQRLVFEALACATPVLSTPARGGVELLDDAVTITSDAAETRRAVERLISDTDERDHAGQRAYRRVMLDHTYTDRVDTLLGAVHLSPATRPAPVVSVLCSSMRPDRAKAVFEAFDQQTYEHRELVFVTNADGFDRELLQSLAARSGTAKVLHVDPSASLGECLNAALDVATGDYVAKWDDDDVYGAEYLRDAMLAFEYADAAIVGKTTYYAYLEAANATVLRDPGREFSYVNHLAGGTIVADRMHLAGIRFASLPRGTDTQFLRDCREAGLRLFSADRFNYLLYRLSAPGAHTWDVRERDVAGNALRVADGVALDRVLV
ncbi:MAG: hypothetical protein QOI55_267 [Actinomycetota bacterium]|nr:hypothetical protein [Actinomycetota bacterium]